MTEAPALPLSGLRIVDLTRVISGPFCTMILGDLGADVIKVESPDGDTIRSQGASRDGMSWYFAGFNRNKRSVVLDLKSKDGKAALEALLRDADALVENFRPGVLDRLGFGEAALRALNPDLVVCAISGFGPDGPYRDRPAFDFIAQAMSGFMGSNGRAEDPPLRSGIPISDLVAGLYGALGVVSALMRVQRGGPGDRIDVGLTTAMVSMLAFMASDFFATGKTVPRSGNDHPIAAPYGLFRTADEPIAIAPNNDEFFGRLMDALDLPELKADPALATNPQRVANRARLNAAVEARLATAGAAHWVALLNKAGVPCGPVHSVDAVFADPQIQSQHMAMDIPHPGHGDVRMLGFPMRFRDAPLQVRHPAPDLGAHTQDILAELQEKS